MLQIIIFEGGMVLDLRISAMMIREEKSFFGDQFGGAPSVEMDDRIFEAGLVDVVDVFDSHLHAETLHLGFVHPVQKRGNPHPSLLDKNEKSNKLKAKSQIFHDQRELNMYVVILLFSVARHVVVAK